MTDPCAQFEPLHSAWVDGELRMTERARLAAHLQRCGNCRAAIRQLRVTRTLLRSLPARHLPVPVHPAAAVAQRRRRLVTATVRRGLARSSAAVLVAVMVLAATAFALGSPGQDAPQVAVPVDVYVADHLVRTVGGPVSTPALVQARP